MADIRINALATTAASTASDDFVAVDGSANGTRKLNAFSPTFGGNLTVSGTTDGSSGPAGAIYTLGGIAAGVNKKIFATGTGGYWGAPSANTLDTLLMRATGFGYSPAAYAAVQIGGTANRSLAFGVDVSAIAGGFFTGAATEWIVPNTLTWRQVNSGGTDFSVPILSVANGGAITLGSNLTVSGGTLTLGDAATNTIAIHRIAGGTNAGKGSVLYFDRGGTSYGAVGNKSALFAGGETSNNFVLYAPAATNVEVWGGAALAATFVGANTTLAGNLTVSGGTVTSGTGTLTLNSSANTVVLQSAGTTALTLDSSQNATFAGAVTATQFKTNSGTTSAGTGSATTILNLSGKSGQMYLVHAFLVGSNDAANYAAFATVVMDGTAARIVSNNATLMTLTLSGTNVQATQTSGVTQTIAWKYTSI